MLLKFVRFVERKLTLKEIKKSCNVKGSINVRGRINIWNKNVLIGKNCTIYPGVTFWGNGPIKLGDNVKIGMNTVIYASENAGVSISDNTSIAANCYLIDMNHGLAKDTLIQMQSNSAEKIEIGKDCWVGANCVIGKGACMHDGAVLGATSFLNSSIPPYEIAAGSPAKIISRRK